MSIKRAFILGAGFSKQAGLPLANELTELVINSEEIEEVDDMHAWLKDISKRIDAWAANGHSKLNIEQLFDLARYDIELWKMRQQLVSVERNHGSTPWSQGEGIETWLSYLLDEMKHTIFEAQKKSCLRSVEDFCKYLKDGDIILTFNYDTVLEQSIDNVGKSWTNGLFDKKPGSIDILKMHGSINWLILPRGMEMDSSEFLKLYSKGVIVSEHGHKPSDNQEDTEDLWRPITHDGCNRLLDMDRTGISNFPYKIGIAGLGRYKPLHELIGSGPTWNEAFRALKEAEKIIVIGFSMSPYDTMASFHFRSVLGLRDTSPRILVVDPHATCNKANYISVFGDRVELIDKRAEEVEWSKL